MTDREFVPFIGRGYRLGLGHVGESGREPDDELLVESPSRYTEESGHTLLPDCDLSSEDGELEEVCELPDTMLEEDDDERTLVMGPLSPVENAEDKSKQQKQQLLEAVEATKTTAASWLVEMPQNRWTENLPLLLDIET